ncbi:related to phytase [Ramularia collo-cygni]|uniref:3-phytase n=1 Tax=Ramularia collo-cygni TaxID=112498 RepID=A0A2D3VGK8_9PEZI|nr:related to phytase [Ramularia collo-cygni]CZT25135.1 related to phytase [Ramularia collo-cygni]
MSGDTEGRLHALPETKTTIVTPDRKRGNAYQKSWAVAQALLLATVITQFILIHRGYVFGSVDVCQPVDQSHDRPTAHSKGIPDYYQTSPELFPGPTPTGSPAFLAETRPVFTGTTYIPNSPLETQVPITGNKRDGNIFQLHGQLSHYFPNPDGFGVDEYALPKNASIVQLHMLSRHGARYPTSSEGFASLTRKIANHTSETGHFKGPLDFLNTWDYKLGAAILVPVGKQELFDSGTLHQIMYGHLFPNNGTKLIARSTTQDRMVESAEYFLAGFFGLGWTDNATLVLNREGSSGPWNNTLAGYFNCNNSQTMSNGGRDAGLEWQSIYLVDATKRLNSYAPGFNWTTSDAHAAQSLCAYETVALGYSAFCGLFTYDEWEGYEYTTALEFGGGAMFQSPTGRAMGAGYVAEILARLQHRLITEPTAQVNVTLDSNPDTFPLDQALNFDFSHDTNIASILTAFGLTQFAPVLPTDHLERNRSLIVSHLTPFAARLDMEIIETPKPLDPSRKSGDSWDEKGDVTRYMHFILNQRTIPLGKSFPECGDRDDGWCELGTFLKVQSTKLKEAQYEYSCFGDYEDVPYGSITNGVPLGKK